MKILFLTSNLGATAPLLDWLKATEGADNVILCEEKIRGRQFSEGGMFCDIEFIVSYSYSYIIKQNIISLFPHRIINLHKSILPWNRGTSPNLWSFLEGTPTGVTIHEIDAGVDTGDILLQRTVVFDYRDETLRTSFYKSHAVLRELFCENWDKLKNGLVIPIPQNGRMTKHFKSDLHGIARILDYDDTIEEFILKYRNKLLI